METRLQVGDVVDIRYPAEPNKPGRVMATRSQEPQYAVSWAPPYEFHSGFAWFDHELIRILNGLETMLEISFDS